MIKKRDKYLREDNKGWTAYGKISSSFKNKLSIPFAILTLALLILIAISKIFYEDQPNILLLIIVSVIIYVWIITVPKINKTIETLKFAFENNEEYNKAYGRFIDYITFGVKNKNEFKKYRIIYTSFWIVMIVWYGFYFWFALKNTHIVLVIPIIILYLISVTLNYFSSYLSICYLRFLYNVDKIASTLEYNFLVPSQTLGLRRIKNYANGTISMYFLVSILYLGGHVFLFKLPADKSNDLFTVLASISPIALTIVILLFLFIGFTYYLQKIHRTFIRKSITKESITSSSEVNQKRKIENINLVKLIIKDIHRFQISDITSILSALTAVATIILSIWIELN